MSDTQVDLKPSSMPRYPGGTHTQIGPFPTEDEATSVGPVEPLVKRQFPAWMKTFGWIALTVFCLIFFTISKLPDDRIKEYIQGNISAALASRGITLTAGESKLGFLFGISYTMKDVTLSLPSPEQSAHIDKIEVSPAILPMFMGKLGATISIKNADGDISLSGSMHGGKYAGSFSANNFDIGKIALLKLLTDVSASAVVTGNGSFTVDPDAMTETDALVQLNLQKIVIDSQSIQGFSIPKLSMSQGKVDLEILHGKGQLKSLQIGKQESQTDDIKANISGDLLFGKTLQSSTATLKANFSLSANLMKSFAILDAILAQGKQADGSYSYLLSGPLTGLNPSPVTKGSGN